MALLLAALLAVGVAYARRASRAKVQREAVAAIEARGGTIDERLGSAPAWLAPVLGEDFFTTVSKVTFAEGSKAFEALPHVARLSDLQSLDLSGASFLDSDLKPIGKLTALEALFLKNTAVGDAGLAHLAPLKNLRRLDLSGTRVTDNGLKVLGGFSLLERLWLEDTLVTGRWMKSVSPLSRLEHLSLAGSKIADKELAHLARFPALDTLRFDGAAIGDDGLAHLAALTHLDNALYLADCPITDAGLPSLALLTRLKSLDLRGTKISPAGGTRISQSLPFCQVAFDRQ